MNPALLAALLIWAAEVALVAALTRTGAPASARRSAIALALAALLAVFVVPAELILGRFALALLTLLALGRTLDLSLREHALGYLGRVWLLVALFDVRRIRRGPPRFEPAELGWLLAHVGLVIAGWLGVFEWAADTQGLIRWSAGAVLCYALVESTQSILLVLYAAFGVHPVRINLRPIVSTTLVEFWGRRWNRVVAGWLRDYAFFPLARRGRVGLGVAAAFGVSTAMHFWVSWAPLDLAAGLTMGSFFVVHAAALTLERKLGVARWPLGLRRTWTLVILLGSSPLFVEPMLRILAALIPDSSPW